MIAARNRKPRVLHDLKRAFVTRDCETEIHAVTVRRWQHCQDATRKTRGHRCKANSNGSRNAARQSLAKSSKPTMDLRLHDTAIMSPLSNFLT